MQTPDETPIAPEPAQSELPNPPKRDQDVWMEKSTVMAFGALFVLPALVILLCVLFFLPFIYNTMIAEPQSGAITQSGPGKLPPRFGE